MRVLPLICVIHAIRLMRVIHAIRVIHVIRLIRVICLIRVIHVIHVIRLIRVVSLMRVIHAIRVIHVIRLIRVICLIRVIHVIHVIRLIRVLCLIRVLLSFSSWTDSRNLRRSVPCAICYGRILWKTSAMRKPQNISLIIVLGVAHISIGTWVKKGQFLVVVFKVSFVSSLNAFQTSLFDAK